MAKTKTKHSTADLIVKHIHRHLQREVRATPKFPKLNLRGLEKMQITSTMVFACAAVVTLLVGYQLVKASLNEDNPAFVAKDAEDYAAQTAFYKGETTETMHSAADFAAAQDAVASAARATQLSQIFNLIGVTLVAALFIRLHQEYGLFSPIHPSFRIRRIR